jgi:hypothetical protein
MHVATRHRGLRLISKTLIGNLCVALRLTHFVPTQPFSSTYLELWCRTFEENFVTLSKPREVAFHSGFDGQRAERTWRGRLRLLAEMHFINLKEGPSGPESYALIYNPYKVIDHHYREKTPGLRADKYHALLDRSTEIGDESLTPAPPSASGAAPAPAQAEQAGSD